MIYLFEWLPIIFVIDIISIFWSELLLLLIYLFHLFIDSVKEYLFLYYFGPFIEGWSDAPSIYYFMWFSAKEFKKLLYPTVSFSSFKCSLDFKAPGLRKGPVLDLLPDANTVFFLTATWRFRHISNDYLGSGKANWIVHWYYRLDLRFQTAQERRQYYLWPATVSNPPGGYRNKMIATYQCEYTCVWQESPCQGILHRTGDTHDSLPSGQLSGDALVKPWARTVYCNCSTGIPQPASHSSNINFWKILNYTRTVNNITH